jgi:hypothetical protein
MNSKHIHRCFTVDSEAEATLKALTERQSLDKSAARNQLCVSRIMRWLLQLREQAAQIFAELAPALIAVPDSELLYVVIGKLHMENTRHSFKGVLIMHDYLRQ